MKLPRRISKPGPLIEYLAGLQGTDRRLAQSVVESVRTVLQTEEGATLLELLEKSTLEISVDPEKNHCALDALNAQSFIPLDLRRIMSDEFDAKLEPEKPRVGAARRRREPASR